MTVKSSIPCRTFRNSKSFLKKRLYLPGRQPDDKLQMMNVKGGGPSSSFITMSAVDAVWEELRQERSQWLTEDA